MIWEELDSARIITDLEAESTKDVFEALGSRMIQEGYAKESYIQALIDREKDYPTGLDMGGFGIAIPHTDVSHVNESGVAIGVLKKPVEFIQMGMDDDPVDVSLVFMLTVKDPSAHIDKLQRITEIIQDQKVLDRLTGTKEAEAIINVIREKEEDLDQELTA